MTLIKSISGIRGTIGGKVGDNLTPVDAIKFASAYGTFLKNGRDSSLSRNDNSKIKVVIGRDARISGPMIHNLVMNTLLGLGIDVIDLGLSTTPTVEIAVPMEKADGGIILTASHNPKQWNALKLLNEKGEFISAAVGQRVLELAEEAAFEFAEVDHLGSHITDNSFLEKHIEAVLKLSLVNETVVRAAKFKVVVDGVNSSGGIYIPALLEAMGVEVVKLFCEPTGHFPHNPEPLEAHLTDIKAAVLAHKADLGIVVDPDVDRLAFISEDGSMFGEEYTLVACADYVLTHTPGATVSNLSSTRALRDVTEARGLLYSAAAVGEVNVVTKMKETNAVIGGEGNGGVIYPASHNGRDSLVGAALFLTHLAKSGLKCSDLRKTYPDYFISKNKIELVLKNEVRKGFLKLPLNIQSNTYTLESFIKELAIFNATNELIRLYNNHSELFKMMYENDYFDLFEIKDYHPIDFRDSKNYTDLLNKFYPLRKTPETFSDSFSVMHPYDTIDDLENNTPNFNEKEKAYLLHLIYKIIEESKANLKLNNTEFYKVLSIVNLKDDSCLVSDNYKNSDYYRILSGGIEKISLDIKKYQEKIISHFNIDDDIPCIDPNEKHLKIKPYLLENTFYRSRCKNKLLDDLYDLSYKFLDSIKYKTLYEDNNIYQLSMFIVQLFLNQLFSMFFGIDF